MLKLINQVILIEHQQIEVLNRMMNFLVERFPGMATVIYTILAFAIPFFTYKVNQKIHSKVDPPWKGENQKSEDPSEQKKLT